MEKDGESNMPFDVTTINVLFKETKSGMWFVKKSLTIVGKFNTEEEAKQEAMRLKTEYPRNAVSYYQDSNLKAYLNG